MADSWKLLSLKEAGVSLIDCVHKTPPAATDGYPYIAIPQMKGGWLDFDADPRLISEPDFVNWTQKAKPQEHDVVLSRRCNPGVTAPVKERTNFALGQNLVLLRSTGEVTAPEYLRWLVSGPLWWDQISTFINVGAVFESLRCADVPKFTLPIPPLPEQRRIAEILGALDDKIELNRKMNQTLEEMAQAIFKSWFIDFDGHAEFVESELGRIPKGWRVAELGDVCDVQHGWPFKSGLFLEDLSGKPIVVGIGNFEYTGGFRFASTKTKEYLGEYPEEYELKPNEILLVMTCQTAGGEILGIPARVPSDRVYLHNQRLGRVVPSADGFVDGCFLYRLFLSKGFTDHLVATASGTKILHTAPKRILAFRFPRPPTELLEHFSALAQPMEDKFALNRAEADTLAELRDTLLPKLISGELRVPEAEKAVESVA